MAKLTIRFLLPISPLKSMVCIVCQFKAPDHWITILIVRFSLGTDLMPQSHFLPPPLHLPWPFESGSCIAASHSLNIFPNRNLMTQGNLCLILALPKIVLRPQIWHDIVQSQRRNGVPELSLLLVCTTAASQLWKKSALI